MIDNRGDFRTYMQNYAYAHGGSTSKGPRRDGPSDEGFVSICLLFIEIIETTVYSFPRLLHALQIDLLPAPLLQPDMSMDTTVRIKVVLYSVLILENKWPEMMLRFHQ